MQPQVQSGIIQSATPSQENQLFQTAGGAELTKGADDQAALVDADAPGIAGAPYDGDTPFGVFKTDIGLGGAGSTPAFGPELITNGGFAADTDWVKDASWTIAAGKATQSGAQVAAESVSQAITLTQTNPYRVIFSVTRADAGDVTPVVGGTAGTARSAIGRYTETILAGAGADFELEGDADFDGDVDLVTVREIL